MTLHPLLTIALPPVLAWLARRYSWRFRAARLFWIVIGVWFLSLLPACGLIVEAALVAAMEAETAVSLPYAPDAYYSETQHMHGSGAWRGRDYSAACGTPLYAPMNGVVIANGFDFFSGPWGSNNSYLIISDGNGREVLLLHGEYTVTPGTAVRRGVTQIGREASIGNSSGCHTHFTLRVNGTAVDPSEYIKE